MTRTPSVIALVALVFCLSGCGRSGPAPGDAVQSYLFDLAEGNYTRACGMLSATARATLVRKGRGRVSCAAIYRLCLPSDPQTLKRDQTQLVFGTVQSFPHGRTAQALVQGTAVAREIRRVTLVQHRTQWLLTLPGDALSRCSFRPGRVRSAHPRRA